MVLQKECTFNNSAKTLTIQIFLPSMNGSTPFVLWLMSNSKLVGVLLSQANRGAQSLQPKMAKKKKERMKKSRPVILSTYTFYMLPESKVTCIIAGWTEKAERQKDPSETKEANLSEQSQYWTMCYFGQNKNYPTRAKQSNWHECWEHYIVLKFS